MDSIAIIGLAVRLPQDIESAESFWELLVNGRNTHSQIPKGRLNVDSFFHPNGERSDTINTRGGHFLTADPGKFDAPFFSMQPAEADSVDPQQRFTMEVSYRALENAGIPMESLAGSKTGVYMATSNRDYEIMLHRDPERLPKYMGTGTGTSILANRVSWFFDCRGPSVALDTACSGSLTGFHLACQSLRNGESNMAIVGGGSLTLSPDVVMSQLSTLGFLSPDGISYSFDHRANGYSKGEGFGVVILKRTSDAIRDNDTIRAIVRATAINQDGRTPGLTQPSQQAQTENILQAYRKFNLDLADTRYFEAHGTGTAVGDPLEAEGIYNAFRRTPENPLYVGSVKANIGHLESGAGIVSIIKSVLTLENGVMPPNAYFEKVNPRIPADKWGLEFLKRSLPFPPEQRRRISINNFGYGGSNAHAVLDDAYHFLRDHDLDGKHVTLINAPCSGSGCETTTDSSTHALTNGTKDVLPSVARPFVFCLSSSDENGIRRIAAAYEQYFESLSITEPKAQQEFLSNLSYSLSDRRSELPWKSTFVVEKFADLKSSVSSNLSKPLRASNPPALSFIFTGQGAQWYAMAHGLSQWAIFQESLRRSDGFLADLGCEWSIQEELAKDEGSSNIDNPELAQPATTILQIALVDLLASWGVRPCAVTGHSSGEIGAAYCAHGLSQKSAVQAAYWRGRVVSELVKAGNQKGGMLAVALSPSDISPYLAQSCQFSESKISIGCVNSPESVTITGDVPGLDHLQNTLEAKGIFARRLKVNTAYHSHHMQLVAEEYLSHIQGLEPPTDIQSSIRPKMFSSVTGKEIEIEELSSPQYWARNLVETVRFADSMRTMIGHHLANRSTGKFRGQHLFLEIGPHAALQRPVKDILKSVQGTKGFEYDHIINRPAMPDVGLCSAMGRLKVRGLHIDLVSVNNLDTSRALLKALPDLPAYPFNHDQRYWAESRLSSKFRFKEQPRHDLLGAPETDWNPWMPRWRNVIRVAENPWLQHHIVSGVALYPASGYLAMVIEGARQLAGPQIPIMNYHLREVNFRNSFPVPEDAKMIEAALHFQPRNADTAGLVLSYNFSIMIVRDGGDWVEACYGAIAVERQPKDLTASDLCLESIRQLGLENVLDSESFNRWESVGSEEYYDSIAKMGVGLEFKKSFQTLYGIRFSDQGQAFAKVKLDRCAKSEEAISSSPHVIHPTDLDGLMQTALAGYSRGGRRKVPILIPTSIKSIRVSHTLLTREPATEMQALSKITFSGFRERDFSIVAVDESRQLSVLVDGFRQTVIDLKQGPDTRTENQVTRNAYHISYKPELNLLNSASLAQLCAASMARDKIASVGMVDRMEMVCLWYMKHAAENISPTQVEKMSKALQCYMRWLHQQFSNARLDALRKRCSEHEALFGEESVRQSFLRSFAGDCAQGELIIKTGENLLKILRGEVDALDLLFADSTVDNYYQNVIVPRFQGFLPVVDMLAHENLELSILEVGAGTGSSTMPMLRILQEYLGPTNSREGIKRLHTYTFTDVSPAFFEPAKRKLGNLAQNVKFSTLDIEKEPAAQGFKEGEYDVVVASGVLHATTDLTNTLTNVRRLLKPGGKVLIFEPTAVDMANVSFIFGLLPGWWLSTDEERANGPMVDTQVWNRLLQQNGFSGNELALSDVDDSERQCFSCILSTALPTASDGEDIRPVTVIIRSDSEEQARIACQLSEIYSVKREVQTTTLDAIKTEDIQGRCCISLVEYDGCFFSDVDQRGWDTFKALVATADRVLWVTYCKSSDQDSIAQNSLATGVTRNVNSEKMGSRWILVTLEQGAAQHHIDQICKVFDYRLATKSNSKRDTEYKEISGALSIPRLVDADDINQHVEAATEARLSQPQCFGRDPSRALSLTIGAPGLLDTFEFDDDPKHVLPLLENEVVIEVAAAGLNEKDVYVALGQIANDTFGFECAGRVVKAGAKSTFEVGDEVCALSIDGALKTFVRTDDSTVVKLPHGMAMTTAAALPLAFATAFYALVTVANLQEDESILIHNAAGAIGQAAVLVAQQKRARIFTTVETEAERLLLSEKYGLEQDMIFSSRDTTFARILLNMTGTGINVVVNSLIGEGQAASWNCIAPLGRFIEIGKSDIAKVRRGLDMDVFARSVSFTSVDMAQVLRERSLAKRVTRGLSTLLHGSDTITAAQPLKTYSVSRLEDAFRSAQHTITHGKVVVSMEKEAIVPVLPARIPYSFVDDATYVIAGGLGGLGRSIIEWMFRRGARNFIILSRSGGDATQKSRDLIADLQAMGARVEAPRCDVTDASAVQNVFQHAAATMPPIRGCLQASMVLKDGLFETMTLENWHAVLRPKTIGTANLSAHLPRDLDFFVLFSSLGSILGTRGQGNYGVANTYLDATARTLAAQGRHCIALNLGPILSVGYVAENDLRASFLRDGFECITRDEFMSLLEYACDPACPSARNPATAQIVTGMRSAQTLPAEHFRGLYWTQKAMLQPLLQVNAMANRGAKADAGDEATTTISALLAAASSQDQVGEVAVEALIDRFAKLLAVAKGEIDPHRPVIAFGIDSLVALELRYWMAREFGATLSVFEIVNSRGLQHLAEIMAQSVMKKRGES